MKRVLVLCGVLAAMPAAARAAQPGAAAQPPGAAVPPGTDLQDLISAAAQVAKNGEWIELAGVSDGEVDFTSGLRLLFLEDEDPRNPPWMEVWLGKTGQLAYRVQMSPSGTPQVMYLKMGVAIWSIEGGKSQEPMQCKGPVCQARQPGKPTPAVKKVRVKTPAGVFDCAYLKRDTSQGPMEIWYSDAVPSIGLVRMRNGKDGLELVAYGSNGSSAFPKSFKANPLPLQNLDGLFGLMPGTAPKGAPQPPAPCDPTRASCAEVSGGKQPAKAPADEPPAPRPIPEFVAPPAKP